MRRRELIETGAGLQRENDLGVRPIGAAQRHDLFGDLRADADAVALLRPSAILARAAFNARVQHRPLRRREPHQHTVGCRRNRGINGGSGRRLEIDRVGGALLLHHSHGVIDRAVDNGEDARLQDCIRRHRSRVDRDDIPVSDHIRCACQAGWINRPTAPKRARLVRREFVP